MAIFGFQDQLHAVVLTRNQSWQRRLGTMSDVEQLGMRVNADSTCSRWIWCREPCAPRREARWPRDFGRWTRSCWRRSACRPGRIVLLPPREVRRAPLGELPTFSGRPLTVAPSAAAWLRAQANVNRDPGPVVAIAGPGLTRAEEEVAAVAEAWPGCQTLTGSQATGPAVLAAVDGARLVHVAAHGQHQRDSPLFSSIKLFDGPVVGYDLDRLVRPPARRCSRRAIWAGRRCGPEMRRWA